MVRGYKVVFLCGSYSRLSSLVWLQRDLMSKNIIVIPVGMFSPMLDNMPADEITKAKIDMSDEVYLLDNDLETKRNASVIEYASAVGKIIKYVHDER